MKGHRFMALTVIWLALGYGGLGLLLRYEKSPAETVDPLKVWPVESVLVPRETTLLLFAHPHCPCTRASIEELARIMARCPATARVYVLFIQPEDVETDWAQTDLWRSAERIPGVVVVVDHGGTEAQRFHCRTSGTALLYRQRTLLFSGGITSGRGHGGDNPGTDTVAALLAGRVRTEAGTPVYGCPLFGNDQRGEK